MIIIDMLPNANWGEAEVRVFHDLEPPRRVHRVRLEPEAGVAEWCEVTGWMVAGTPCPAVVQKVDDSGEGVAWLVHGGDAGLRVRRAGAAGPWDVHDAGQWGAPLLMLADPNDLQ